MCCNLFSLNPVTLPCHNSAYNDPNLVCICLKVESAWIKHERCLGLNYGQISIETATHSFMLPLPSLFQSMLSPPRCLKGHSPCSLITPNGHSILVNPELDPHAPHTQALIFPYPILLANCCILDNIIIKGAMAEFVLPLTLILTIRAHNPLKFDVCCCYKYLSAMKFAKLSTNSFHYMNAIGDLAKDWHYFVCKIPLIIDNLKAWFLSRH